MGNRRSGPGWRAALQDAWLHRGALAIALLPLAWLFRLLGLVRAMLYQVGWLESRRVKAQVIVVGNVVAGGAGKTPVVMAIVRHLREAGFVVGVVSRGYGRSTSDVREVLPNARAQDVGDEPLLIQHVTQCPAFVGASRVQACQALLQAYPATQIIVCDDGLQHYALCRDLEICVFDDRGCGNGWLLPAGPLREPWPRTFRAAVGQAAHKQLIVRTDKSASLGGYGQHRQLASLAHQQNGTTCSLSTLRSQRVLALAGIAQPEVFFHMLRALGLELIHTVALPDHAHIEPSLLATLEADFGNIPWVCTEKDAVKLWTLRPHTWAVPLTVDLEAEFWSALMGHIQPRPQTPLSSTHGHTLA